MNQETKRLTLRYALIHCFFWMGFATIMGFASVFLLSAGFTNTGVGIVIAASGTVSALLQPVVAAVADRGGRWGLRGLTALMGGGILLLAAAITTLSLSGGAPMVIGLLYGSCLLLLQLALPLVNAIGTEAVNRGQALNWGAARGVGSVAYAAVSCLLGILTRAAGTITVPLLILLSFALLLLSLTLFPLRSREMELSGARPAAVSPAVFFRRYPRFGVLLVGTTLLYTGHMILGNFTFQIIQSKGGGSVEMGMSNAIAACAELPTMFLFAAMVRRRRCDFWLKLSGLFFTLKALLSYLTPTVELFYLVQLLQMLGWGLISVALVYYINALMDRSDAVKGQAYATMTFTLGSVTGSLMGGWLLDLVGVGVVLSAVSAVTLTGALILCAGAERVAERVPRRPPTPSAS